VYGRVAALPAETTWDVGMTAYATELRAILLSHRDGAKVFSGTYLTDVSILEQQEAPLQSMLDDGFTITTALRISALAYNFTVGFCIEEQAVRQAADDRYSVEQRTGRFAATDAPLVASGAEMFGDQDERFAATLGIVIDAGRRLRGSDAP
jgi:hypothetical protein